ncbi:MULTISPECIES: hypothetical protein [Streptomyces]|uniref:Uncharacterized protein n=2 Tax=Streptomyces TaxID=1883 RepID=A0A420V5X7_9ACTN|nr:MULTISPECIES: hypothetical protein [Streptomyces]MZE77843.1 hypothetical protein [Streptomyces sp. SID5475]KNE81730.1 hypothetical protein ADZ36_14655 [Streptomyces fradiae]OFA50699.1 hypothetical protein BEN35_15425 [Streptomyces fradiae]PQM24108.1 hypothetical protein Sfr7A_04720 [Streptomyces xinghaiensis]RKM97073.1 hypothetical protein SFRA_007410 [Streptomyces xinghaiensis]
MSLHDDLRAAQRCLDELGRTVGRLERQVGGGPDIRRVRSDTEHLRESLALLRDAAPDALPAEPRQDVIVIPDAPYNTALWADAEDEGLGARHGQAP